MKRLAIALWLAAAAPAAAQLCATDPRGWCAAPTGDPCGRHRDAASCRADPKCYGMPYRGESLTACQRDGRGFGTNCPTVGCTSAPPR